MDETKQEDVVLVEPAVVEGYSRLIAAKDKFMECRQQLKTHRESCFACFKGSTRDVLRSSLCAADRELAEATAVVRELSPVRIRLILLLFSRITLCLVVFVH